MKLEASFLRSKVAIRIFVLFICCAILPIAALTIISFTQVTKQLSQQTQKRLHQASKDVGMAIAERLFFLEGEMKVVASKLSTESNPTFNMQDKGFSEHLKKRLKGLVLIDTTNQPIQLYSQVQNIPEFTPDQKEHIRSGGTLLSNQYQPDNSSQILMSMALNSKDLRHGILLGEISSEYLWGANPTETLPPMTELIILDHSNNLLFSTLSSPASFPKEVISGMSHSAVGKFEWVHEKKEYLASYWSLPLQTFLFTPKWTVVLSESKSNVLAPMAKFKKIFPLVVLASLLVVLLLSVIQIRRSMIPLEKLREGTRRIAARDFDSRVIIKSGDEFEELGASFNTMASQLDKQFKALNTLAEIDRVILSALDTDKIIDVVLSRIQDVFPCDSVSVTLLDPNSQKAKMAARIFFKNQNHKNLQEMVDITAVDQQELSDNPECIFVEVKETFPHYLAPLVSQGIKSFLVLPIILKQVVLSGIMALGYIQPPVHSQEDFVQARRLANQVAVALSNALLIKELDQLSWGTLRALARAIDAKSPWTAGHSERVTGWAMKIGRVLGLSNEEIDALHRGGLLHDLGKIGVPPEILDKPGKLTAEEEKIMRQHAELGARILEPIAAYADVIPMVLQHHERFGGAGYPYGIDGGVISLGARIFAVADSFDAMTSDRPYRKAMDWGRATEIIKQESGKQFDPKIVQAFLQVMAQEIRPKPQAEHVDLPQVDQSPALDRRI
jgi:putative nucleotidyltransferase with HDIG domain